MPDAAARRFGGVPSRNQWGTVPDMYVALPAPGGGGAVAEVDYLAGLKFIHFGPSRYSDAASCRAVAQRAEHVHGEYVRQVRALDQLRAGTAPGAPPGPAEVKLSHYGDVRPLVVGSFAEMSEFVDALACTAATREPILDQYHPGTKIQKKKIKKVMTSSMSARPSRHREVTPLATDQPESDVTIPVEPMYVKKQVSVLGKQMAYYEVGSSDQEETIVFVHGNPTSSYMWRNVMPHCDQIGARLIALDLIGMGESEKLDNVDDVDRYALKEQSRYFAAFLEAVGVSNNVTFACHSWGGTLAAYWGSQNPDAVRGLVSIEVVYMPFPSWERVPKKIRGGVKLMLRKPFQFGCCGFFKCCSFDLGAHLIMKKNLMLESMSDRVGTRKLTPEEMNYYRRGFTDDVESRRPILAFVRSIPVAGSPKSVVEIMDAGREWIVERTGRAGADHLPTLFLSVEPGTMTEEDRDFIRGWRGVTEIAVKGGHMVSEDCPDEVGMAIAKWFRDTVRKRDIIAESAHIGKGAHVFL